jgi:DNA-directed RNA polymerase specialized sigma24 family protein
MVNTNKADYLSLIDRFKAGDISAFEEVLLRHQDKIYKLCWQMLENSHDAEDAQDVFLKAYQNLNNSKETDSLVPFKKRKDFR